MSRASHQLLTASAHTPCLRDRTVSTGAAFPTPSALEIDFFEAGYLRTDTSAGVVVLPTEWANQTVGSVSIAGLYDIRLTVLSGSSPSSGDTVATWLAMVGGGGGARKWGLSRSSLGVSIGSWFVEIRNNATLVVLTSATYTVSAAVSSP